MRLRQEGMDKESLQGWVRGISGEDAPFAKLLPGVFALHAGVPDLSSIISSFPPCNEWGLMDDSPTQSLRSPPPAPRGKQAQEESGSESEAGQPHDSSSSDEVGRVAATREVIPVDDEEEEDDDDTPLITRLAREAQDEATVPVVPEEELHLQLEAQCAEHQDALSALKAAQAKAKEEHRKALATAQARLDKKSDLITRYAGQIQGLRAKLEVQTKATESSVTAAARHEIQLNAAKDKVARLETERAAVREELTKASEDNAAKAAELVSQAGLVRKAKKAALDARLHHGTLIECTTIAMAVHPLATSAGGMHHHRASAAPLAFAASSLASL
ncbi:uncharacterized protein LOC104583359 [Brachypodium distachyon]|uniref:uncharacterized protein LOC104583359 n=1 Tax=Brachypodium distachyon TaxID=15368 RepID=UPI00052FDBF2|nr:uncharacterized protein LOC104583359 [Brachypodium distachyon]|eukprot:XP_010233569.1 uncharacterized protein LOC104583359 [Brachypodium distachyon]